MATEGPAHVADAHVKGRGQAVELANFAAQKGCFATESHGADAGLIRFFDDAIFQLGEQLIGVAVIEGAQQLMLTFGVTRSAIAADAHAEDTWPTALALGPQHGFKNGIFNPLHIAPTKLRVRQTKLSAHVFAAATLKHQTNFNVITAPLLKMNGRASGANVIAGISSSDGVDTVLAQVAFGGGLTHSGDGTFLKGQLVVANGGMHKKDDAAGVLAEGLTFILGEANITANDIKGVIGRWSLLPPPFSLRQ